MGTNCRGYLNLAAEGRFEEGYILSREPNPVAAMCAYVCSAPCERACRRGDIDRPLAIRAMKRFLVEWHAASGIPDDMPVITPRDTTVAVVGAGPAGLAVARELAVAGHQVTVFDELPFAGGTMLIGVPAFRLPREAIEMDFRLVERLGVTFRFNTRIGRDITFEQLQEQFDAIAITAGAMDPVPPGRARQRPRGHPVRRRLHEEGQPGRAARGGHGRRHHRRRLHRHGLLAHEPAPRRPERDHRLPAHPLRARRGRGGAGRDRARGRPDGVPRQPHRGPRRRGRQDHRRALRPQPPRRAGRHRPPRPGAGARHRVRRAGADGHPRRQPGGGQHVPAGRGHASRSTGVVSVWTPARTPRTSVACSRAATS